MAVPVAAIAAVAAVRRGRDHPRPTPRPNLSLLSFA